MTDLRERVAEALTVRDGATYAAVRCPDPRLVDAVMVEVQRDLDELEARVERKMARLRQAGEVIDAAEADAARLAEAGEALAQALSPGYDSRYGSKGRKLIGREICEWESALAAHRERGKEASDPYVTLAFWECGHIEVDRGRSHACPLDVCGATYAAYAPVADEDVIRADERERLSARVYENGWCPTCGKKAVVT